MHVRRLVPALAGAVAFAVAPPTASAAQKIVPAQSEVSFVSKQMGVPVQGKFERFDGQVNIDPARPESGRVSFTVDLSSVAIATAEAVAELKKPDWFGVAKFPAATFQSSSIKSLGNNRIDVIGKLTIKGITRSVDFDLAFHGTSVFPMDESTHAGFLATATINRSDFNVSYGIPLAADEVNIRIDAQLIAPSNLG